MGVKGPHEKLGEALRGAQDPTLAQVDVSGTKARLIAALRQPRSRARARGPVALALAAMALGLALIALWPRALGVSVAGEAVAEGAWLAARDAALVVAFSEGTRFELAPGAQVRLTSVDDQGARLAVERGVVHAEVTPGRGGRWRLEAGPYAVIVTGTRFDLSWRPDEAALGVDLHEGAVRVEGPNLADGITMGPGQVLAIAPEGVRLRAAEGRDGAPPRASNLVLPPPRAGADEDAAEPQASAQAAVERAPQPAADDPGAAKDRAAGGGLPPSSAGVTASARWRRLAGEARYLEALAAAKEAGIAADLAQLDAASLALLADVARFAGDGALAREALSTLRRRFPGEPAARAAFLLGRLAFEGDPASAASWFSRYLAEAPGGPLAREAAGRLVEAHRAAGNHDAAAQAAAAYLARFPDGPHAPLARRVQAEARDPYR